MTDAEQQLRTYIAFAASVARQSHRPAGFVYAGLYDLLDRHGSMWTPGPARDALRNQACFDNAYRLARRRRLRYVEGYALSLIPVHHAWCVDADGRVLDPTWGEGQAYFGVEINLATVAAVRRRTRIYTVLDNYRDRTLYHAPFTG